MSVKEIPEGHANQTVDVAEQTRIGGHGVWRPALKGAAWAFLCASVLLLVSYAMFFRSIHPQFIPFMGYDAQAIVASGKDLLPVSVGASRKEGQEFIIEDFRGDEAILLLPREFRAEHTPISSTWFYSLQQIQNSLAASRQSRRNQRPEFNRSGDEATQIAMVYGGENYRGKIADVALRFTTARAKRWSTTMSTSHPQH